VPVTSHYDLFADDNEIFKQVCGFVQTLIGLAAGNHFLESSELTCGRSVFI
jgi:hypothetical protein